MIHKASITYLKNKVEEDKMIHKASITYLKNKVEEDKMIHKPITYKKDKIIHEDPKGNLFSIELLISLFFIVLMITAFSTLKNEANERLISKIEISSLEKITNELCDDLIKKSDSNNTIPGLGIENNNKTIVNTVSYEKFLNLNNTYSTSIKNNVFNNQINISITLQPINNEIDPIKIGDSENGNNIVRITRIVKCDFYSKYLISDLCENNIKCNHENIHSINSHRNDSNYDWNCINLQINQSQLRDYNYYLIMDDDSYNLRPSYILDNYPLKNQSNQINTKKISLNNIIENTDGSEQVFLHIKLDKNTKDRFKGKIIATPKTNNDNLDYIYYTNQECNFIIKTWYS